MIRTFDNNTLCKNPNLIKYVAEHLSEQNINEVRILFGGDAPLYDVLLAQATNTESGIVLFDDDGNPRGMGGICPDRTVWLVITKDCDTANYVGWLKAGRRWLKDKNNAYPKLYGYCLRENELSQHWMRWFGFDFAPEDSAATTIIADHVFLYFQKTKN